VAVWVCGLLGKEPAVMTGSFWAPIVIPIVVVPALAAWLALVWYADAHPRWKAHSAVPTPGVTGAMVRTDISRQIPWGDAATVAGSERDAEVSHVHEEGERVPSTPPPRAA
jgi:hypothetical protein